jgi:hypothetical protein
MDVLTRLLAILLLSALTCLGQLAPSSPSVTLSWDPSPSTNVSHYWIYSGFNSGQYVDKLNAGPGTQFTVTDLIAGKTYFFAATASDINGQESIKFSNEVSYTVPLPPLPPGSLTVTNPSVQITIQSKTTTALTWSDVSVQSAPATGTNQVFRLKIGLVASSNSVTWAQVPQQPGNGDKTIALPPIPKLVSPKSK